jgi:hypothetical protein
MYTYVFGKYLYIPSTYKYLNAEHCVSGFCGKQHDANVQVSEVQQQSADLCSDEGDCSDPCPEDEDFFQSGQDAEVVEEAISKFMDGMEAQEHSGFKDLHRFLGRLPVPTAKERQGMMQVNFSCTSMLWNTGTNKPSTYR